MTNFAIPPELSPGFDSLSSDQKYAFSKFAKGNNIFVTGPGGTGKTRLIQYIVEYANFIGKSYQVCALTGCAAVLLNCKAKTIHSWSGIKLGKGPADEIVRRIMRNRYIVKSWREVEVLIIDEVSMMSRKIFDLLDQIGRIIRKNPGKAFGGIQLVFTGDFFQLPPIPDYDDPETGEFCFQHPKWSSTFKPADCIELQTFFRQKDPVYIKLLQEIRRGQISEETADILESRVLRGGATAPPKNGVAPTKLFPIRAKVDFINDTTYKKLSGDERVYHFSVNTKTRTHIDTGNPLTYEELTRCEELSSDQLKYEVEGLTSSMQTDKTVRLKIGSLVMCTANIDVDRGICNGSQGVVVDFAESNTATSIGVEDVDKRYTIVPVVRFSNGLTMRVTSHQRQSEEYPCIVIAQIPLCLAWALTIHKIQGATLDVAEIDIGKAVFESGQSYVALSRVKTLDGLYLSDFNPSRIKANPLVVDFYKSFPKISEEFALSETDRILRSLLPEATSKPATTYKQTKLSVVKKMEQPNPFAAFTAEFEEEKYVAQQDNASDALKESEVSSNSVKTIRLKSHLL